MTQLPFPGMDPYLENPELWSSVHSRLIIAMADQLVDQLSERYRIEVEKRVYYSSEEDSLLVGIPDVTVARERPQVRSEAATLTLPVQPETVTIPTAQQVTERYLEIREVTTGSVISVIELLSPTNKRAGEGRRAYLKKRHQVLGSLSHLVEIDLLRGGQPLPMSHPSQSDYRLLVSQSELRPKADLYAFSLRQTIPPIPIPLAQADAPPILSLQPLLESVYAKGRYYLAIDYEQQTTPPLSEADAAWAADCLQRQS